MSENNALVPVNAVEREAYHLYKSGFFKDLRGISQGVTKITLGRAMGIDAASALMGLFVSGQGKLTLSANLMARCIKAYKDPISGHQKYKYRLTEHTDRVCVGRVWEWCEQGSGKWAWEEVGPPVSVKVEDFKHLTNSQTWKQYPKNMLFARWVSNVAKWHCADVFGGAPVYLPDEIPNSGLDVDGETLEVKVTSPPPGEKVSPPPDATGVIEEAEVLGPQQAKLWDLMAEMNISWPQLAAQLQLTEPELKASCSSESGAERVVRLLEVKKQMKS